MSAKARSRVDFAALLAERRLRREFLKPDAKQAILAIATTDLALLAYIRNDFLLLHGSGALRLAIATKVANAIVGAAAIVVLRRSTRPKVHDRALAIALFGILVAVLTTVATRWQYGEFIGAVFGLGVLTAGLYLVVHGPLWHRGTTAVIVSVAGLALAWNPRAAISPVARNSATFGCLVGNFVGILSARSFEDQRKKRFRAERDERRTRRELAKKVSELAKEKDRALGLSHARASFLAAMSHEFRTPMNAVIGLSELLVAAPLQGEQREHARIIRDSARSLLALLNDILDFAKIDANKLALARAPFDVQRLVQSVGNMLKLKAEAKAIELKLELAPGVPRGLVGDEPALRRVLVNLLSNAVTFTERGRAALLVSARPVGSGEHIVTFRVEDTGIGIAPEVVKRLFEPFEQADEGITRRYGGSGLGLAISKQIVTAMGSTIEVESELGRGSVFRFSLRTSAAEPPRSISTNGFAAAPSAKPPPLRILVVDDHPVNQRVAVAMLGRLGYGADVASSGDEAIAATKAKGYDIVLMDLHMPGMSGFEATRRILERAAGGAAPRIVAMTASVFEEDREACREAAMTDFVAKPLDAVDFERVISRAVEDSHELATAAATQPVKEPLYHLRQLEGLEPGLIASLCQEFIANTEAQLVRIESARQHGDAPALATEANSIKDSSAALGMTKLLELAATIEGLAKQGVVAEPSQITELSLEFERVKLAIAPDADPPRTPAKPR